MTLTVENKPKSINERLVSTKSLFTVTIVVIIVTCLGIWLFGVGQHRTVFINSVLSVSILSTTFFMFISIGLYKGIKLKDNIGKVTDKIKLSDAPDFSSAGNAADFPVVGEGIGGIILGIIFWIIFSILIAVFAWLFGAMLWAGSLIFIAMLYWIFFRALRLVFKNSNKCKGNIVSSLIYSFFYTILYNCWIYGIILVTHYLIR